jgi:uncharacterized protein YdbL (DUF1318 family)
MHRLIAFPMLGLVLGACVTINIYFPAAAAEEAARTIVRDVLQGSEAEGQPDAPPAGGDSSSRGGDAPLALRLLGRGLELLVPSAHAAGADIDIDTPAIRTLRVRMQQRQGSLAPFFASGAIGFDRNGDVAVRDLSAAPLAERNRLKKLVEEENADRARLYREIAAANGHPEWADDVRKTFARVWVEEARRGWWYQDGSGAWRQR